MTNEQLTEHILELEKYKAKAEQEHESFRATLEKIQDSLDVFNKLAEDVHIMANNMANMQKTLETTEKKVDSIMSEEFLEYKENKKKIKEKILDKVIGAILGVIGSAIVFFGTMFFKGGI